jgi:DNA (cytosine-5)-methyltransferase 1
MCRQIRCVDLFCGAGGSSRGASMAGVQIVAGVDCWKLAADTFQLNYRDAVIWGARAEDIDPQDIAAQLGTVDLLIASPECTSHSVAKGRAPRSEASRDTAFQVIRYARALRPRWIVVENVPQMMRWVRFCQWMEDLQRLGYQTQYGVLDAQDYGVPQSRKRLFVVCDLETVPTLPAAIQRPAPTAADILGTGEDRDHPWPMRPVCPERLAKATMQRFQRAVEALGPRSEFILVYYGTDGAGGYQSIDRPLRTVTTIDRFAYVRPAGRGHEMRMLQPPELAAAMGFPRQHQWAESSRRDRIKLIGNAVCPPVMCAIVRHLIGH